MTTKIMNPFQIFFCFQISRRFVLYKNVRWKSFNSHDWLKRRKADPYIELSKQKNYRCRSAFKLLEINERFNLIKPGDKVLDVGAAPGSWSQVLAEKTNSNAADSDKPVGLVIAIDLNLIHPIEGVIVLSKMDFTEESSQNQILENLGENNKLDLVCSDMAPAATGVKALDKENIVKLIQPVILFSLTHLRHGGGCLIKIWDGGDNQMLRNQLSRFFKYFSFVKPKASYTTSSETYLLAREFLGVKR